jgi:thiosulfate reductase cytochrome b subunit
MFSAPSPINIGSRVEHTVFQLWNQAAPRPGPADPLAERRAPPRMIGSGLQIYGAFTHFGPRGDPYPLPNPWDGHGFPKWARLGGWLAGGLNWHFALAWPFVVTGLVYLIFLALSGEWRSLLFRPRDLRPAWQMQLYYLRLRKEHPPQGSTTHSRSWPTRVSCSSEPSPR